MTPRRFRRLRAALDRRQPDLTVVMENVHKPHNLAAVVRSCDAVGVFEVHAVAAADHREARTSLPGIVSGGVRRWVGVRSHPDVGAVYAELRDAGFELIAAHPTPGSRDFREPDYTRPTAFVLGQEKDGLSEAAVAGADGAVAIPMLGMGRSLNVSVAAALLLFEAARQRTAAGLYETSRLDPELYRRTLFEWAWPELAELCRRRGVGYPPLGPEGEVLGRPWEEAGGTADGKEREERRGGRAVAEG